MAVADLAELGELCVWMRSVGATSARVGDIELTLGPPPPSLAVDQAPPAREYPVDAEREELMTLLHSSGADVTPFLALEAQARAKKASEAHRTQSVPWGIERSGSKE